VGGVDNSLEKGKGEERAKREFFYRFLRQLMSEWACRLLPQPAKNDKTTNWHLRLKHVWTL